MESPGEVLQLCRLCLANSQVNVPIFGEQSDIRQISFKISSCLPVKIAADDLLPKNICEGCLDKLELLYTFWNSSQEAEKKLRAWLQEIRINNETISAVAKQIANSEVIALSAGVKKETEDDRNQSFDNDEDFYENVTEEAPPPKRARHSPIIKEEISISEEFDYDEYVDVAEPYLTKVEDESDMSDSEEDGHPLSFLDFPETSVDEQQAGPSGVGKDGADAPLNLFAKEEIEIVEEDFPKKIKQEEVERNAINQQIGKKDTKLKCDYCDKTYMTKSRLIIHTTIHTGEKVYKCDRCPKIYSRPNAFKGHYYYRHIVNGIFNCETCNKIFYSKVHLNRHQKIHAPLKDKFICGYCGKIFLSKEALIRHILRGIKMKEYKCEFCFAVFLRKCLLTVHKKCHTNEKYPCKICGKIYSHKSSFYGHMDHHKGKLTCDICGKLFSKLYNLNQHKNGHSKETKYPCEFCGQTFFVLTSLRSHSKTKHQGAKTAKCERCCKTFIQKVFLNIHTKKCFS